MAGGTVVLPEREVEEIQGTPGGEWRVVVFDNDHNTFDEVIGILQIATGCSLEEAEMETWEIHHQGRSIVHYAGEEECRRVAEVIATIGIQVVVEPF